MSDPTTSPKAIAFIPARGGSKRIPGKNLLPLGGKPLLRHAVDAALGAGVFSKVIVSSDDPLIADLVSQWSDVSFHQRDPALADDFSRVPEVVHAYLKALPEDELPETAAVLLPPCPFRTASHVREAFEKQAALNPKGFLVSVTRYDFPPQFALRWGKEDSTLEMVYPEVYQQTTRSQSVPPLWHPNGAMYVFNTRAFLESASFFASPLIGYEMLPKDSIDIDWPHQFAMAESLFKQRETQSSL